MNPYEVAAWDVAALRRGVTGLLDAAEAAPGWVHRGDAVRATLAAPGAWDGQGSAAALDELTGWLAVAARTGPPLRALAEGVAAAEPGYREAQEAAATALRAAAGAGLTVSPAGEVTPGPQVDVSAMEPAQAAAALERAAAAAAVLAELERAQAALARADALVCSDIGVFGALGIPGFDAAGTFRDLSGAVRAPGGDEFLPIVLPTGRPPDEAALMWDDYTLDQQLRLIELYPAEIGATDGLPGWACDLANRTLLDADLAARPPSAFALSVQESLDRGAAGGAPVQLLLYDPDRGLAAVAVGDVDTADDIAIMVPGMDTTVEGSLPAKVGDAATLYDAALATDPGSDVAVVAWLGYAAPQGLREAAGDSTAQAYAPALSSAVTGLAQRPTGQPPPRTTVVAHSYGSVLTAEAQQRTDGGLDADAVVILGSPGVPIPAWEFEAWPEVYAGEAGEDVVADTGWHGMDTSAPYFGAVCIGAENSEEGQNGHSHYIDPSSEALWNIAAVMTGRWDRLAYCR